MEWILDTAFDEVMHEVCSTAQPKCTTQDNIGEMLKRLWIREIAEARLEIEAK